MSKQFSICHVTSVHRRYDTRIFEKQIKYLSEQNYKMTLIVNDTFEDEKINNIQIISTKKKYKNKLFRIIHSRRDIKKIIKVVNADIYHLHDPELLLLAGYLKRKNKKVIFDSHEDYPLTISVKGWLPKFLRNILATLYSKYESYIIKRIDGAIACYHWTRDRFVNKNSNVELVFNFPKLSNESLIGSNDKYGLRTICYAGGLSKQWNHSNILEAVSSINDIEFKIAGKTNPYFHSLEKMNGWNKVNYLGFIPLEDVYKKIYGKSTVGMALLDYIPQCKGTIGNLSNTKLFEYMQQGLPVICTDFLLWDEIVTNEKCGITVNPHNTDEIKKAIEYLINNPEEAERMGKNGFNAVKENYNWENEFAKMMKVYKKITTEDTKNQN